MTLLLVIHVMTAIIAFGPVFTFPILGLMAEHASTQEVGHALALATKKIGRGIVVPVGLTQIVTGVWLLLGLHLDLRHNVWLGSALVIYIFAMGAVLFHQLPTQSRIVELTAPGQDMAVNGPIVAGLGKRVKAVGIVLTLALLVIIVLMAWKPGFTAGS